MHKLRTLCGNLHNRLHFIIHSFCLQDGPVTARPAIFIANNMVFVYNKIVFLHALLRSMNLLFQEESL